MSGTRQILVFIGLALYAVLSLAGMSRNSSTWDETHYLGLGCYLLKHKEWNVPSATLQPPFSYYLNSLPLLFCTIDETCFEKGRSEDILAGVRRGQCLMEKSWPSGDALLILARLPMIVVGLLLGYVIFRWAFALYGTSGGLLSLFLYCLSPNILAHSGLITPDLCLTAFGFMTVYLFWLHVRSPSGKKLILCSFALGLTILSKYAGLLWVPILFLLACMAALQSRVACQDLKGVMGRSPIMHLGFIVVLAFLFLLLAYRFDVAPYFSGMDSQKQIIGEGFPAFLNGKVSQKGGWWYYYLFAFAIKVPIPALVLFAISFFTAGKRNPDQKCDILWLFLPVLVIFAAFSLMTQVNIGLRYVLPAFPFLMTMTGSASMLWSRGRMAGKLALIFLVGWYACENGSIYPHYLSYFNQIAGGAEKGYRYLVDSNLDWGQDLKGLKKYMDENSVWTVKLSYFGTAEPRQYGIDYQDLRSFPRLRRSSPPTPLKKGDLIAVSATNLYPIYVNLGEMAAHLRSLSPVARVGYSILIYRLEEDF